MVISERWLTSLVLGADPEGDPMAGFTPVLEFPHKTGGSYQVLKSADGKPIARTSNFTLYATRLPSGSYGVTKVAVTPEMNYSLGREASILRNLRDVALAEEPDLHYESFFPQVHESFVEPKNGRHILVLGYPEDIEWLQQLDPLSVLIDLKLRAQKYRTDLKSIWILRKLLKVVHFAHSEGVINHFVNPSNVLLGTDEHNLILFDWSHAQEYPAGLPEEVMAEEVRSVVRVMMHAAGGNLHKNRVIFPHDPEILDRDEHQKMEAFFSDVLLGAPKEAFQVYTDLEELIDVFWPPKPNADGELKRDFHPFNLKKVL